MTQATEIEKIRSLADLKELPFTTKEDLRVSYPYDMFALPLRDIVRIHASSGTTGKPIVVGISENDIHHVQLLARELSRTGITEHDVVQIGFTYGLFTGGLGYISALRKTAIGHSGIIPLGNLSDQILIMKDFKYIGAHLPAAAALSLARLFKTRVSHLSQ